MALSVASTTGEMLRSTVLRDVVPRAGVECHFTCCVGTNNIKHHLYMSLRDFLNSTLIVLVSTTGGSTVLANSSAGAVEG